jgi:hypothetical protein
MDVAQDDASQVERAQKYLYDAYSYSKAQYYDEIG